MHTEPAARVCTSSPQPGGSIHTQDVPKRDVRCPRLRSPGPPHIERRRIISPPCLVGNLPRFSSALGLLLKLVCDAGCAGDARLCPRFEAAVTLE